MAAGGITSAPARIQKRHAGDPIATRARFVADLPPRSGWLGSRPAIVDTVGSPGPDAGASCTGRGALAKQGPAGPTPRGPLPRRIEPTGPTYGPVPELVQSDADTPLARKTGSGVKAGGGTPRRRTEGRTRLNGHYVGDRSGPRHVARRLHSNGTGTTMLRRFDRRRWTDGATENLTDEVKAG